jgi:hypothetical protein
MRAQQFNREHTKIGDATTKKETCRAKAKQRPKPQDDSVTPVNARSDFSHLFHEYGAVHDCEDTVALQPKTLWHGPVVHHGWAS